MESLLVKKGKKIKNSVIVLGIILFILIIIDVLPFWFMWAGNNAPDYPSQLKLQKKAVETSILRFQKIYTINNVLPLLVLSEDYTTAIDYYRELEILNGADNFNTKLIIYALINTGNYNEALSYAYLINDKSKMAQIYLRMQDYHKAEVLINELMSKNSISVSTYLYKAELEYAKGNIKEASIYADKVLSMSPTYYDVLYLKSKICKKQNNKTDAKRYFYQAKYLEEKRKDMYK